ncbi:type II asparaginase [Pusillimonas sp. TS35]|uniref:asparaginase n=1 Tax=Paracandidimonas lactea TaxID=2895524 RepID=UPI001368F0F8|nr:asparaginase [Paracandidimonas lactea]MYN13027.1 type II asparaginase [Pusillimonas sp. TS35]
MTASTLPAIALLGTGGTIAATAAHASAVTDYDVTEGVDALLAVVPELATLAHIVPHQVFNTDSRYMTGDHLLRLCAAVQAALDQPAIAGAVVTHGTDTIEETAYFLNLMLKSAKPVVLTGAMRPASALSADGPMNLFDAVAVAASPAARGHGVLVAMNGAIHGAREVSKHHTTQVQAFWSGEAGCMGSIQGGVVSLWHTALRAHTMETPFSLQALAGGEALPRVDILYDHQDAGAHLCQASIQAGVDGIVIAAMGNGSLSAGMQAGVKAASEHGLLCIRSTRTGAGPVTHSRDDDALGTLCANTLNPQKARILLMLALTVTGDRAAIQGLFERY